MTIKRAKIQMPDGTIRIAKIDVPDTQAQVSPQVSETAPIQPQSNGIDIGGIAKTAVQTNPLAQHLIQPKNVLDDPQKQKQTAMGLRDVGYETVNQGTLNYLTPLLKKWGVAPETSVGAKFVGAGANLLFNPIAKAVGAGGRLAQAGKGALVGGAYNPSDKEIVPVADASRIPGAVIGGAAPIVPAVVSGVKRVSNIAKAATDEVGHLGKVRSLFFNAKHEAVKKFGSQLEELATKSPDKSISIRDAVDKLNFEMADNPKIRSLVNRSPTLKSMVENPDMANNITLKESQNIMNEIKSKIPLGKLSGNSPSRFDDLPIYDLLDDIKTTQLDVFPEMAKVRSEYGKVAQNYEMLRKGIGKGKTRNFLTGSNYADPDIRLAAKELSPEAAKLANDYRLSQGLKKALGYTAGVGAGTAAVGYGLKKILGK